jgi:hypothetical protein
MVLHCAGAPGWIEFDVSLCVYVQMAVQTCWLMYDGAS